MIDPLDKTVLISIFSSNLDRELSAYQHFRNYCPFSEALFESKIIKLSQTGFVDNVNEPILTHLGRELLKVVLIGGVFDILHPGHIHTLRDAKSNGDVLVVVIARNSTAKKINNSRVIYHCENLRKELVSSIKFVDVVIIGQEGTLYDTVENVKPDIIALGYDQKHSEKDVASNCSQRGLNVRVIRLNTTIPNSKSTKIKEELGKSLYDM
ncbi:MAG TPA: adenylyltransferase/cytidyltransferase family protein [Nitrososphaeraceae archaeon]